MSPGLFSVNDDDFPDEFIEIRYQGYRAVDMLSQWRHYAKTVMLFDDLCVLARCVDPFKSRPDY